MSIEKALRYGGPIDQQFSEFVEPEDAVIEVTIKSDIRQVGKVRLTHLIAEFLKEQGYTNVVAPHYDHPEFVNEEFIKKQKNVKIQVEIQ